MKTFKNLFTQMLDLDNIKKCIKKASKGKRQRYDVKKILNNLDYHASKIRDLLLNDEYDFHNYTVATINTASEKKERTIAKPRFKYDQIIHHVVMSVFSPIVLKGLYEHVYGSIPKNGPHKGKKHLEKWIRKFGNKRFYVFKGDIRHFYDSIDHNALKNKLSRKINDSRYLNILFKIIDSYNPGLPKGFYCSQWLANFYLKEFDHFIKRDLKAPYYMRYMDDIVILHPNKRKLHRIKDEIEKYLNDKLLLELKPNWTIYRFVDKNDENGRDIDFMGFRFYRNKTTLRKSNLRQIRRKANRLNKKRIQYNEGIGKGVTVHDAQSMLSYLGWTKHTDVYTYFQDHIKGKVNPRQLRKKVSRHQRILNRKRKQEERLQQNKNQSNNTKPQE